MKKNDYFIGECVDQSHDGKGIVKYEGFTYFVNGMITGEVGQIKCIKMLKNYGVGRLIELQKSSMSYLSRLWWLSFNAFIK